MTQKTRILVLGGGFGGLDAALDLDKTFVADPSRTGEVAHEVQL